MSALQVLRQIKELKRNAIAKNEHIPIIQWGVAEYIRSVGLENMNRKELSNHLEARDLSTKGTRIELIDRLRESLADEQLRNFAYEETIQTENMIQADLEERGAVYACGSNSKGELGLGDVNPRKYFTVIPQLRGVNISYVASGIDMCYAVSEESDVYVWGGGGFGTTGINPNMKRNRKYAVNASNDNSSNWLEPQLLHDLNGEDCLSVVVGLSHCIAHSRGGDCFVWGKNYAGQLGLGDFVDHPEISINNSFPAVKQVHSGANHTVVLTNDGAVYSWGHASNGRLGTGAVERNGAIEEAEKLYFPIPTLLRTLESVKQIACGTDHTLAIGSSGVWSWGNGSGGKLGLDDCKDRYDPVLIPKLRGKFTIKICAGTWHSMAIVQYPPMNQGGWLHTFGSGYHGQLALLDKVIAMQPEIVEYFVSLHLLVKDIATGSHHCAALTIDNELYTWGSNVNGCLGRKISEKDVLFTPIPGIVSGFGAIVNHTGRGFPRSIACGKEFTIVATHPYHGPSFIVAKQLMEEDRIREQDILLAKKAEEEFLDH